jgi:hypothetical protein
MKIEPKHLKGLVFNYSEKTVVKKDGRDHTVYTPMTRPLEVDDVIGQRDLGDGRVSITTNDGKRHIITESGPEQEKVKKKASKEAKE